jgi:hypothetical protein
MQGFKFIGAKKIISSLHILKLFMDTVVRSKTAYDADYMNEQDFSNKSQINANVCKNNIKCGEICYN